MAAPTLETNAGATILRIIDGTSGDPATWGDVWDWDDGGGSSGGDGDVPKDGGGTAKVSTLLTEIVANALYTIQKSIQFGNGSDSSFFRSTNEMVYFEDGAVPTIENYATLQQGELQGDWGINGSDWSCAPSASWDFIANVATSGTHNMFASKWSLRSLVVMTYRSGVVDWRNSQFTGQQRDSSSQKLTFGTLVQSVNWADVFVNHIHTIVFAVSPTIDDFHFHYFRILEGAGDVTIEGYLATECNAYDVRAMSGKTVTLIDPRFTPALPRADSATATVIVAYTVNIRVNDKNGAALESATVAATSFGNIVSNDAGATFYRCVEDHTAGTFATDVSAGKWELTTEANATLAGVDGTAENGAWVTGIDYVKAAAAFSVSTDAGGDIAEQTVTRKQWKGTSEALLSFAPYTLAISKAGYETLTLENIVVDAAVVWVQELQQPYPIILTRPRRVM